MLENSDSSLRSAASCVRCWAFFRELTARPHFLPTEEGALAWASFLGSGRFFEIYAARLEKACLLPGVPTARKSKAVLAAGYGLAEAGDRSRNPRPATSEDQRIQFISTNRWRNELPILALLSWTLPHRSPTDSLPLYRQWAGGNLISEDRQESKVVIGPSGGKPITKVNNRKHMAGGP